MAAKYPKIPLGSLTAGDNPRQGPFRLSDLKKSIQRVGLRTPLEVRSLGGGMYAVVNGSRRLHALSSLQREGVEVPGLDYDEIPCILIDDEKEDVPAVMLAANVQAELPPSQVGEAMVKILEQEFWSLSEVAGAAGKTPAQASLLIQLAKAPQVIRDKVDSGKMSLSAFKRVAGAGQETLDEIAEMDGKITVARAKRKAQEVKDRKRPDQDTIPVPEEKEVIVRLHEVRRELARIVAGPLSARERHVLWEINRLSRSVQAEDTPEEDQDNE